MNMTSWLWLAGGMRTTTALMIIALLVVGIAKRRPVAAILSVAAWLLGFEAAWQISSAFVAGRPLLFYAHFIIEAAGWVLAAHFAGVRADWRLLVVVVVAWVPWLLTGMHSNYPGLPFDVGGEIANVIAKTAWALAYLVPLLRAPVPANRRSPLTRKDEGAMAKVTSKFSRPGRAA